MRKLAWLVARSSRLRYVLVGVVAFSLGGATIAQAVAPNGLMGVVQLADRTDTTHLAAVDANGNVSVNVNNFPASQPVSVANTASSPVPVKSVTDPATNAVVAFVSDIVEPGTTELSGTIWYTVPAGKRLAIQYVGGSCDANIVSAQLLTSQADNSLLVWPLMLGNRNIAQQLTIYVEAGRTVRIALGNPSGTFAGCIVQFAGYLVAS